MTQQQYPIDNLKSELEIFLKQQARKNIHFPKSLTFKLDQKNGNKIIDGNKNNYQFDMSHLQSFKEYFEDKSYKYIRIHNWQFQFTFTGKKCHDIILSSQYVVLIANKTQKKQIKDITFRISIANKGQIQKFDKIIKGYINRIGKRNLLNYSDNVSAQMNNLISFIKRPQIVNPIERLSISIQQTKPQIDPLNLLNSKGKQILEKLRYFISRQNLLSFMYQQELSEEGARKMRRLIFPQAVTQGKKTFSKNLVEALQKNLDE